MAAISGTDVSESDVLYWLANGWLLQSLYSVIIIAGQYEVLGRRLGNHDRNLAGHKLQVILIQAHIILVLKEVSYDTRNQ